MMKLYWIFISKSSVSAGPGILQKLRKYHSSNAGNFISEILTSLDNGLTIIIDLGNADEEVMLYFSRELSSAIFGNTRLLSLPKTNSGTILYSCILKKHITFWLQ